jgi:hypothetical protein
MARRQAFRITGNLPALAGVPMRIKREALPLIVKIAAQHTADIAPKRRGFSSSKSIASRIKGVVDVPGEWGSVRATAPHSHLLELGVEAHSLAAGSGKKRRRRKKSGAMKIFGNPDIIRRGTPTFPWHPGFGARPFMQRGLDAAQDDIEGVLQREALKAFSSDLRRVEDILGNIG